MSYARRWGLPSLLVSIGLHGALVGAGLLPGPQARAARQPELPASVVLAGSSVVEVEAATDTVPAPPAEPAVKAEAAVVNEPKPAVAAESLPPPRVVRKTRSVPKPPASAAPISSANALAVDPAMNAPVASDQKWPVRGVLSLGYAVARAISYVAPAEAAWRELPVGHVGTIRLELTVDESHHVGEVRRVRAKSDEPMPPPVLEGLVDAALLLMRGGQFALSRSRDPGVEQLIIDVTIRAPATDEAGADIAVQRGFSGATPARPGKAYFRYGTGRVVEATVTLLPP